MGSATACPDRARHGRFGSQLERAQRTRAVEQNTLRNPARRGSREDLSPAPYDGKRESVAVRGPGSRWPPRWREILNPVSEGAQPSGSLWGLSALHLQPGRPDAARRPGSISARSGLLLLRTRQHGRRPGRMRRRGASVRPSPRQPLRRPSSHPTTGPFGQCCGS